MNMEEVEFSQSYVQSKSDRRQLIRQKHEEAIGNHRQIVPGGSVKDHKLIKLPLTHQFITPTMFELEIVY